MLLSVASFCSRYGRHALPRQSLLVGRLGVAGDLGQRRMAADGCDYVCTATGFGQAPAGGVAQAVGGAVLGQAGLVAAVPEPIPKARSGERLAVCRGEQRQRV